MKRYRAFGKEKTTGYRSLHGENAIEAERMLEETGENWGRVHCAVFDGNFGNSLTPPTSGERHILLDDGDCATHCQLPQMDAPTRRA